MAEVTAEVDETTELQEEQEPEPTLWVVYRDAQHFEIRTFTVQDWAKVGVKDGKLLHFYTGNKHRVARSEFDFLTEDEFAAYILSDPRLELVTE